MYPSGLAVQRSLAAGLFGCEPEQILVGNGAAELISALLAEIDGPEVALALTDRIALDGFYLFHAIRADLLRRLGRDAEAARAYRAAIERTGNAAERDFLERRLRAVSAP